MHPLSFIPFQPMPSKNNTNTFRTSYRILDPANCSDLFFKYYFDFLKSENLAGRKSVPKQHEIMQGFRKESCATDPYQMTDSAFLRDVIRIVLSWEMIVSLISFSLHPHLQPPLFKFFFFILYGFKNIYIIKKCKMMGCGQICFN